MRCCQNHFQEVRKAIIAKGMQKLLKHEDTRDIQIFATRWIVGYAAAQEFDPLIVAMLEINNHAHMMIGMAKEDPRCPLCLVEFTMGQKADQKWIDNVTDLMLLTAKANDLL